MKSWVYGILCSNSKKRKNWEALYEPIIFLILLLAKSGNFAWSFHYFNSCSNKSLNAHLHLHAYIFLNHSSDLNLLQFSICPLPRQAGISNIIIFRPHAISQKILSKPIYFVRRKTHTPLHLRCFYDFILWLFYPHTHIFPPVKCQFLDCV